MTDTELNTNRKLRKRVEALELEIGAIEAELATLKQAQGEVKGYVNELGGLASRNSILSQYHSWEPLYTSAPAIPAGWQLMDMGWIRQMIHVNAIRMFPDKSHDEIAQEIDRVLSAAPKPGEA